MRFWTMSRAWRGWLLGCLALAGTMGCRPPWPAAQRAFVSVPGSIHLALGEPVDADPSDDLIVDHGVFVLSYNPRKLIPNWVAWRLIAEDLGGTGRSNAFHQDHLVPSDVPSPRPRDYAKSGYDRGHMCPSGDRTATVEANEETFVMTNMQPQRHALNAGPWLALEDFERSLTRDHKQVFVLAGGLFEAEPATIPGGEAVPRANFKIIVVLDRGQDARDVSATTTSYAVIMPNDIGIAGTLWAQYLVSIDEIERQSGYDFLSGLPREVQSVVETRTAATPEIP